MFMLVADAVLMLFSIFVAWYFTNEMKKEVHDTVYMFQRSMRLFSFILSALCLSDALLTWL